MKYITIDKQIWATGLERLAESFRLFGPLEDKEFHNFRALAKGQMPDLNFLNTRLSAKALVLPQSESMFEYTLDAKSEKHHILQETEKDYSPRAVIGIRPCDAAAFVLVKNNFDTPEYKDPYWIKAYEATTFVGLACSDPCRSCFCTSAGGGPADEKGLDLLLFDAKDHFLAKVISPKGEKLAKTAGWDKEADAEASANLIETYRKAAADKINTSVATENLKDISAIDIYDAPFWEEVSFSCINCGTCTYGCPTCWCFDIQDEVHGSSGMRMRNWDSCMYPLFTLHGSGHNPRGTKLHRVRQRFMHKLKYFVDKYDAGIQCTGCGRCIRACPVNIDIRKVCDMMNSYGAAACDVAVD
jgi:ferredoxin